MKKYFLLLVPIFFFYPISAVQAQERLIFHHIPKNGGTSTRALIERNFKKPEIIPHYFMFKISKEPTEWFLKYKFIRGHFPFFYLQHIPGKRITFLRDPIKRILSAHQFWIQSYVNRGRPNRLSQEFQIPVGDPIETMKNHQTLFLSSLDPKNHSIPIEKHLKSAKENLCNEFFFFGITEELSASLSTLFEMLGFPTPDTVPTLNSTKPQVYSKELLQKIKERNGADIELYDFAKRLYKKKFAQHP